MISQSGNIKSGHLTKIIIIIIKLERKLQIHHRYHPLIRNDGQFMYSKAGRNTHIRRSFASLSTARFLRVQFSYIRGQKWVPNKIRRLGRSVN